jgi:hypothetical protein
MEEQKRPAQDSRLQESFVLAALVANAERQTKKVQALRGSVAWP